MKMGYFIHIKMLLGKIIKTIKQIKRIGSYVSKFRFILFLQHVKSEVVKNPLVLTQKLQVWKSFMCLLHMLVLKCCYRNSAG